MSEYEKELKKLQISIAANLPNDLTKKVEELLESYRVDNSDLSAQLGEKNKMILDLEAKLKRTENKYFSATWKLSSTKREINDPLKKRFPNLRNTITLTQTPLLEKEKNLRSKTKNTQFLGEYEYS